MSSSSAESKLNQGGDIFNAPLIGDNAVYKYNNTLYYIAGGIAALFLLIKFKGKK